MGSTPPPFFPSPLSTTAAIATSTRSAHNFVANKVVEEGGAGGACESQEGDLDWRRPQGKHIVARPVSQAVEINQHVDADRRNRLGGLDRLSSRVDMEGDNNDRIIIIINLVG